MSVIYMKIHESNQKQVNYVNLFHHPVDNKGLQIIIWTEEAHVCSQDGCRKCGSNQPIRNTEFMSYMSETYEVKNWSQESS